MKSYAILTLALCIALPPTARAIPEPHLLTPEIQTNEPIPTGVQGEYLLLIGGSALRSWENLRRPGDRHDNWWANFVAAANIRTHHLKSLGVPNNQITWMAFRPSFLTRQGEEGKPIISWTTTLAARHGVNLIWFSNTNELINYINSGNNRRNNKLVFFEFYGHSNRFAYMFDYSNEIMAASKVWLHERDLSRINRSAFAPNAFCKSYGCHTGESMSTTWQRTIGLPLWGAVGKTNYQPTGWGEMPNLSSPGGAWTR